jgi:hypothetical protein
MAVEPAANFDFPSVKISTQLIGQDEHFCRYVCADRQIVFFGY